MIYSEALRRSVYDRAFRSEWRRHVPFFWVKQVVVMVCDPKYFIVYVNYKRKGYEKGHEHAAQWDDWRPYMGTSMVPRNK
jgi:hypothetical protein